MSSKNPNMAQLRKKLAYFEKLIARVEYVARELGRKNILPALELARESIEKNRKMADSVRQQINDLNKQEPRPAAGERRLKAE